MMNIHEQTELLNRYAASFNNSVNTSGASLQSASIQYFQMNLGKKCNQACKHCHVDASPSRTEMMSRETIELCIEILETHPGVEILDITGGAPEMHPDFQRLVEAGIRADKKIIDRCNLTILEEPGFEDLAGFLSENKVEIVASLPHYSSSMTNSQRGSHVFEKSITALQKLNRAGYGKDLVLNLVYNPAGFFLSSSQKELEKEFKTQLLQKYEIVFHQLYCINNIPVNRYLQSLIKKEKFSDYMEHLVQSFNPATVDGLMCRHQISVDYNGFLYDCDFNQMLDMKCFDIQHIRDFKLDSVSNRKINTSGHCFGCTAGAGSSCTGELV